MRLFVLTSALVLVSIAMASSQSTDVSQNAPAQESSASADGGQAIPVVLMKTVDAKKLKAGDPVIAKVSQEIEAGNGTVIPAGSTVSGHIVAATARAKGDSQSSITIAFDNIALKNGQQMPLQATIQAVGAPPILSPEQYGGPGNQPTMTPPGTPNPPGTLSPSGPMGGGAPVTGLPQPQGNSRQPNPNSGNSPSPGGLTTQSTGVVGLRNITLQSDSTLTSTGKDLKLDSGTEMILRVHSR